MIKLIYKIQLTTVSNVENPFPCMPLRVLVVVWFNFKLFTNENNLFWYLLRTTKRISKYAFVIIYIWLVYVILIARKTSELNVNPTRVRFINNNIWDVERLNPNRTHSNEIPLKHGQGSRSVNSRNPVLHSLSNPEQIKIEGDEKGKKPGQLHKGKLNKRIYIIS